MRYIGKSDDVEGFVNYMTKKGYNAEQLGSSVSVYNDVKSLAYDIEGFFLIVENNKSNVFISVRFKYS